MVSIVLGVLLWIHMVYGNNNTNNTINDTNLKEDIKEKNGLKDIQEKIRLAMGKHGEKLGEFKDSLDHFSDKKRFHGDMMENEEDLLREMNEFPEEMEGMDKYDFDPSEGLSFIVSSGSAECFYESIELKEDNENLMGAYLVSSENPRIDFTIKAPDGSIVYKKFKMAENEYHVENLMKGTYSLCFSNVNDDQEKLITHVTTTLDAQHPIEKEHVSRLSQYAAHLDVKLGEIESEQRLLQLRTDRHIKTEKSTNERVTYYSSLEFGLYLTVSVLQVFYMKRLLHSPRAVQTDSWA